MHNLSPVATEQEIHAAAMQYVRKISGSSNPAAANAAAVASAVELIAAVTLQLLASLKTNAPSRLREVEAAKARLRSRKRFAPPKR